MSTDAAADPDSPAAPRTGAALLPYLVGAWLLWRLGAWAAPHVGVWPGIGAAAAIGGLFAVALRGAELRPLLRIARRDLALGAAAGAVMIAATYLLYEPATRLPLGIEPGTRLLYERFNDAPLWAIGILMPVCVVSEELVWRGLGQQALEGRLGRWGAAVAVALVYASSHFGAGLPLLPYLAGAVGLYWGLLRAATGGLVAPLTAHLMWDITVLLLFPLA